MGFIYYPRRSINFIICSYQALKRLKERCWLLRLSLTLVFSCVIFTFIFIPLVVLYNLRRLFLNEIAFPVWMREVVFRNLLILSSGTNLEYPLSHLTYLVQTTFMIIRPWDGWKEDVDHQGSHSHLFSLVFLSLLYSYPWGSYIISEYYLKRNCISCLHKRSCISWIYWYHRLWRISFSYLTSRVV